MTYYPAPRWSAEDFDSARARAAEAFRHERLEEPIDSYNVAFAESSRAVETLFQLTDDLTRLVQVAARITIDTAFLEALRYLTGPPISEDDLRVLSGTSLAPARLNEHPDVARRVVQTVRSVIDLNRFPWVSTSTKPTPEELHAAITATSALMATRRVVTKRANSSKQEQEERVLARLAREGFDKVQPRTIRTLDEAPRKGEFCGESLFGSRKADVIVRLRDGRIMPIECKVSNSSTNSVKRLNNDAAAKAVRWIDEFGSFATIPSVVLSGVYKTHNLIQAQNQGLTVFWAHDLDRLAEFLAHAQ